ncbi:LacI family DNA-binding transcriptional regulator [Paenibacillus mucilaginosus]|uniref:Transcriptional regulator, LacI family n=1 Tax=Paenibacillus mucilaginosus (strain KNP414) TaxID=1036673 RepID=F8FHN6_PAEMK|nr:LacI family DNA-binding transcriptional regulator [Paenibacillus mucilaginosus]AEI42743.1 transcriptional regulator, LacI family [Paenibacillus mucilaginosus KNP414]MCG7217015.1 LacI family transcriptional regulator [Paenibacillus mucilaginosus]WDM26119.1 LacI family DNA-binding transcriptional regulator [Paenibacillus mucilaginosus]WFA20833.1 LacI family transcriptional regulator [Paenibacillus mucilaginosus]
MNIKTVAKLAGVSVSTVSKIINNYSDISAETREKVLGIMKETGYIPSNSAKTLATKKSGLIGVVFAGKLNIDFTHPFFVGVLNAFKRQMGLLGYDLLFFSNEKFHASGEDYLARCRHFQVEGCILLSGQELEPAIHELDRSPIPCIGVDLMLSGASSGHIMSDSERMAAQVVEHFYLLGYRDIGYLGASAYYHISSMREAGLLKSLDRWGLPMQPDWFIHGDDFSESSGCEAMKRLIAGGSLPRALFAGSDHLAIGAIRALMEHGLQVPGDVAVIGCDDVEAARYVSPPLTTIRQNKDKIGKLAAMMLYDLINNQMRSSSVLVEPELIVRASCGARREG